MNQLRARAGRELGDVAVVGRVAEANVPGGARYRRRKRARCFRSGMST
jgi:hypothetical protein